MFTNFKKDDYVFISSTKGDGVGNFEVNQISSVNSEKMELIRPLTHNYKEDFNNHSQVIKIPQYSTVIVEKDIHLFHKAQNNGTGGVIVMMANAGFTIKGYIVDPSSDMEAIEETDNIKKSKAGIIIGLANYSGNVARKVFDLKLTTSYPTLTLPQDKNIIVVNHKTCLSAGKFQHITIPPDLNLHLTSDRKTKDYLFFKPKKKIINCDGSLSRKYIKLLTVTYPTIDKCPIFTNKKYAAGFMMAFAKMPHWNSQTHFSLELYALKNEDVRVPIGLHKKGELGVTLPFPNFYENKKDNKFIKYYIQPFIIISHEKEKSIQVKFW